MKHILQGIDTQQMRQEVLKLYGLTSATERDLVKAYYTFIAD